MRENCTSGSVRGASGNRRPYRGVDKCSEVVGVPATYVQATPDLMMGDLLKNMRSSQIFSVCGLPEIKFHRTKDNKFQVELLGLDVFDPVTMEATHRQGDDLTGRAQVLAARAILTSCPTVVKWTPKCSAIC